MFSSQQYEFFQDRQYTRRMCDTGDVKYKITASYWVIDGGLSILESTQPTFVND